MMNSHHPYPALVLAISAAMLVLPACSTEEVRPDVIIPDTGRARITARC